MDRSIRIGSPPKVNNKESLTKQFKEALTSSPQGWLVIEFHPDKILLEAVEEAWGIPKTNFTLIINSINQAAHNKPLLSLILKSLLTTQLSLTTDLDPLSLIFKRRTRLFSQACSSKLKTSGQVRTEGREESVQTPILEWIDYCLQEVRLNHSKQHSLELLLQDLIQTVLATMVEKLEKLCK